MPREIFGDVANPTPRLGSQSRYTVPVSIAVHVLIAAVVVIVPLMATDLLPPPRTVMGVFTTPPPTPPPPPPAAGPAAASSSKQPSAPQNVAPTTAPDTIAEETVTTSSVLGKGPGVDGGLPNVAFGGKGVLPVVPPVPDPPAPARPVPVGGKIKEPVKVRHVPPVYPMIAQQAKVEGTVIIEAIIGVDGRVREARVIGSRPLLDDAALTAVRQWVFTPTMLNGSPIPVIMTVRVNFRIN